MSWKKILFLCLSFVFVFGGMFGFYINKANAQYAGMLVPQNDPSMKSVIIGNSGGLTAKNNWGSNTSSFNRKDNVKTNLWYDSSKYVASEYSVGNYNSQNKSFGSDKRIIVLQNIGNNDPNNKFQGIYSVDSSGQVTKIDSYQNSQGDIIKQPTTQGDLTGILAMEKKKSLESSGVNPYAKNANSAKDQAARQDNATRQSGDQAAEKSNGAGVTCSWSDGLNVSCWAAWFANNVILSTVGLLSGIAGFLFDKILDFSVINMGTNVKIGAGDYLSDAWKIMRDVVNIAFIFVLLYIGIMTIIKGFESGTSKMIATVVVVALIINFSLFFTKIIIDSSNIIAVNFYETIKSGTGGDKSNEWSGVAGAFLNTLKLGTIDKDILKQTEKNSRDMYLNIIKISLGGSVILIVLALVLFIASIMFITRYVILIILLVTSAAAVGSWILPSLKKSVYDKWWSALIGQAFFAPVFLFFLFLSLRMTEGLTSSLLNGKGDLSWSEIFLGNPSSAINLIIMYLVVIGFLVGSIVISKSLSNMAGSGAGKVTGFMGGAAMGAVGFAGRQSFGRIGNSLNSEKMQEAARNAKWYSKPGLLLANAAGAKMKKGSFDPRTATGAGALLGAGGISGKDGWAANKGGILSDQKKWQEYKEGIRGKYTEGEITARENAAVENAANKGELGKATQSHNAELAKFGSLEEEEKREKAGYAKADKTEQERIEKRLIEIQKMKEEQTKNVEKAAEAQKKAEKAVRDKERAKYKASKSDKDKLWEAAQKAAKAEEKKDEEKSKSAADKPKK